MLVHCTTALFLALIAFAGWSPARGQTPRGDACPEIVASGPADVNLLGDTITFNVRHTPASRLDKFTYTWTLSAGDIVSGQGTTTLVADLMGVLTSGAEITVEIDGPTGPCPKKVSYSLLPIIACHRPLNVYGNIRFEDEQAQLDNLAIELQNGPDVRGHIICYDGRRARPDEARRRCERAKNYLTGKRQIELSRITTVVGGHREDLTVELWIVPKDAEPPQAVPTVDLSDVQFANETEKDRNEP